jgi:hypothetical protein
MMIVLTICSTSKVEAMFPVPIYLLIQMGCLVQAQAEFDQCTANGGGDFCPGWAESEYRFCIMSNLAGEYY